MTPRLLRRSPRPPRHPTTRTFATPRSAVIGWPINRALALAFIALLLGKLLFRPQLAALGRWLDGVVNAMLIAIGLAYTVQIVLLLLR